MKIEQDSFDIPKKTYSFSDAKLAKRFTESNLNLDKTKEGLDYGDTKHLTPQVPTKLGSSMHRNRGLSEVREDMDSSMRLKIPAQEYQASSEESASIDMIEEESPQHMNIDAEVNGDYEEDEEETNGQKGNYSQLKMLVNAHLKEYWRTSPVCIILVGIICFWIMSASKFILVPMVWPDDDIDRMLNRPVYPAFQHNEEDDSWSFTNQDMQNRQLKYEEFFQYIDMTNSKRTNQDGERVKSWTPLLDFLGPHIFAPLNCFSVEEDKFESPIIGYIKSDSILQKNMINVLASQF